MAQVAGRIALVTGAGGPMGHALARRLLAEGAAGLALTDISGRRLEAGAEALRAAFPAAKLSTCRADVTRADEAGAVCDNALSDLGQIDLLANLVGGIRSPRLYTQFLEMEEAQFRATLDLNLMGGFHLMQALVPGMKTRGFGRVLNVASVVFSGEKGQADYAAAKAAVASLTRSLAAEFAPEVTVNCIAPGLTNTSVTANMPEAEAARLTAMAFNPRMAEPDEIADAALYFLSEGARFVTGEIMAVSGGIHPHL